MALSHSWGEGRRDDGSSPHKQGGQAWGWGLSPSLKLSVDLATSLECPLGGSTKDLDLGLSPGDDVAREGLAAAGGQVVDLPGGQLAVPDVEMGQLTHKRLGGVKPSTKSVLWRGVGDGREERVSWVIQESN